MDQFEKFYNKSLRFLSYRPRSEKEVIDRLKLKKAPEDIIKKIIKKLKEYKLIDDVEFAKWWIEQRTIINPKPWRIIKLELNKKGIDKDLIFDSKQAERNDLEILRKLVKKRIEKHKNIDKKEIYLKLVRYLAFKGFNYNMIKQSIDEILRKKV